MSVSTHMGFIVARVMKSAREHGHTTLSHNGVDFRVCKGIHSGQQVVAVYDDTATGKLIREDIMHATGGKYPQAPVQDAETVGQMLTKIEKRLCRAAAVEIFLVPAKGGWFSRISRSGHRARIRAPKERFVRRVYRDTYNASEVEAILKRYTV